MGVRNIYSIRISRFHIRVSAGRVQVFTVMREGSVTRYISNKDNATFEES
jgi:hypothetical protein